MNVRIVTTLLALSLAVACTDNVGAGKTKASVSTPATEPAAAAAEQAPAASVRTIEVDTAQSKVHAVGAKITRKHDIAFDSWSGKLRADGEALQGIEVTIQMSSIRADVEKLTGHLQSADFFDVEKFPTATFVSSRVEAKPGADGATHLVTGAMTMHGVTKELSFPATVKVSRDAVSANTEFVINRKDFGIVYPGMPDDLIQDEVVLTISLKGNGGEA